MGRIVVPLLAGNFSAWGLLGADMVQSAARTRILRLDPNGLATAQALLDELVGAMRGRDDATPQEAELAGRLDLRYHGQEHWLSLDVPLRDGRFALDPAEIHAAFTSDYGRTFGGIMSEAVEIVATRASLRVPLPRRQPTFRPAVAAAAPTETVEAFSFNEQRRLPFAVVPREAINGRLQGPAIVTENTATLYLDAAWTATVGPHGELVLEHVSRHAPSTTTEGGSR